jgi:hypothetical protein
MLGALLLSLWAADVEPEPVAFVFLTPSGRLTHLRSSDAIAYLDERFDEQTDLDLDPLSRAAVEPCGGRLSCLTEAARPDYQRRVYLLGNGGIAPFREHLDYVERKGLRVPKLMLVISGVGAAGVDILTGTLVDTDAALAFRHRQDEMDRRAERALQREATLGPGFRAELNDPSGATALLDRFFAEHVQPVLEARGHWRPFGSIVVRTPVEGAGVAVDGRLLDTTRGSETRLDRIVPGQRSLRIEHPDFFPFERQIEVQRRQTTTVEAKLQRQGGFAATSRTALFWSGLVLAAAGTGLAVGGAIDGAKDPITLRCPECSGGRFRAFSTTVSESALDPLDESGPLIVPFGYSLALTGATWSIGTASSDARRVPWLPFVLGLAGGGFAYGLSAALNPSP